ncbi:[protein-PII] uridylyltransferase [Neisseria leonii]|uniref:[protein-PII] uridylyltransferase n=1 Tax=Neisseria leonii TaxID=2995413 RepID=UPI00237ABFDC|nr:[protein-PII] uridylyltransferase [Neisseria sp. 3986]MDD9325226.1 [protein-PII] uridylyltransferase [Neisseria sp. 3986]
MHTPRQAVSLMRQQKEQAAAAYLRHRRPGRFFRQYGAALDTLMQSLWQQRFAGTPFCLLAVGGYGRGEMYPHSDLDLALVTETEATAAERESIADFVQFLWDNGLTPAVKTGTATELAAAAADDLTAETALLEARFLCGSRTLADRLTRTLIRSHNPAAFIEGKLLEMQERHNKQQGSGAVLEPNVKTCPGGLRDIHTMIWLAKAQGLSADIGELTAKRLLTRAEAGQLMHSHKTLAQIRIELHLAEGREQDRLLFDLQSRIAGSMGFHGDNRCRSEQLMHTFYRAAKAVKQLNGILLPVLAGRVYSRLPRIVRPIDGHYYQVGRLIAVYDIHLFRKQPEQILTAVEWLQKRSGLTALAPDTLRAWWAAARKINRRFYENEANRRRFIGLFRHGSGLTRVMRFLNLYGVLGRYLPAWGKIVGLLQHDLFHIYPVDDHILTVLRNIRRLNQEEHAHELPFASAQMAAFDKPHILYLAALFHDIAKGRGGDHAQLGVADARRFAEDHFLDAADTALLCWLVEDHLLMSLTAQKEDIGDPAVIERFCAKVQTPERLAALYLLTVADIRGTNPKIWNSWKANLLETLFQTANRRFSGQTDSRALLSSRRQEAAAEVLAQAGFDTKQQRRLWQALGDAYFVRHEKQEIVWHLPHLAADPEAACVQIRPYLAPGLLQVMVYLPNRPRLFARLCRIFSRNQLDIAAARAFVSAHDYVLDTFLVQLPAGFDEADTERTIRRLNSELHAFIAGNARIDGGGGRPGRRARHLPIPPVVELVADEEHAGWYSLDVIAVNRPYLLADIADVFNRHGISLRYAKINTLDERAEDSFWLFCPQLGDTNRRLAFKRDLLDCLSE